MSPGTHSGLLFRASDYLKDRNTGNAYKDMRGLNPDTFKDEPSRANDDAGFVKAILIHLFP